MAMLADTRNRVRVGSDDGPKSVLPTLVTFGLIGGVFAYILATSDPGPLKQEDWNKRYRKR